MNLVKFGQKLSNENFAAIIFWQFALDAFGVSVYYCKSVALGRPHGAADVIIFCSRTFLKQKLEIEEANLLQNTRGECVFVP